MATAVTDGNQVNIPGPAGSDGSCKLFGLVGDGSGGEGVPGNSSSAKTVPETDTGGLVEHTKAFERTVLKELGKLPS